MRNITEPTAGNGNSGWRIRDLRLNLAQVPWEFIPKNNMDVLVRSLICYSSSSCKLCKVSVVNLIEAGRSIETFLRRHSCPINGPGLLPGFSDSQACPRPPAWTLSGRPEPPASGRAFRVPRGRGLSPAARTRLLRVGFSGWPRADVPDHDPLSSSPLGTPACASFITDH